MPKRKPDPDETRQQAVEEIAGLVDNFCREHLNEEYAELHNADYAAGREP